MGLVWSGSLTWLLGLGARRGLPAALWQGLKSSARFVVLVLLALLMLTPFVWMFLGSLRSELEIFEYLYPLQLHTFIPAEWTLKNYLDVLGLSHEGRQFGLNFGRNLLNSVFVTVSVTTLSLIFSSLAAFFFARARFPYKYFLLVLVVATMLIPRQAIIVPLFIVIRALGWENSYLALILPWYASPFITFLLTQFFEEIPKELDESAIIDGASPLQILWYVILPNAVPGLITAAIIDFQFIWNEYFWPLIAIGRQDLQVIQVAIASQTTQYEVYWGRTLAGSVLASLPVILLFLVLQRHFIQGAVMSGLKA